MGIRNLFVALVVCANVNSADPPQPPIKAFSVPYQLTGTQHVMVRAKFNGRGPFNFIVDTGAPAMFTSKVIAEKAGLEVDKKGWAAISKLEIEGGVIIENTKTRVDDLFQLKGVNGLGLAGVELHGVIGYNVLAKGRIEFDFTKDRLKWTPLDFEPLPVTGMSGKGGAPGGLDALGSMMQFVGGLFGLKPQAPPTQRGYLGIELSDGNRRVTISAVYPNSPADKAGFKVGDSIDSIEGQQTLTSDGVRIAMDRMTAGSVVKIAVTSADGKTSDKSVSLGGGI